PLMSLVFCLPFSSTSHLPRSLSSSGLKPSFLGIATVWQYWQFLAGKPPAFACDSIWGVAPPGAAAGSRISAPRATATAATGQRLESVMGDLPQGVGGWRLCSRVTRSAISLGCIVGHGTCFPATVGVTTAWFHSAATTAAEESRPLARVRSLAGLPRSP